MRYRVVVLTSMLAVSLSCNYLFHPLATSTSQVTPVIGGLNPTSERFTATVPAPTVRSTSEVDRLCIPPREDVELLQASFEDLPITINEFLDRGGTPDMLAEGLASAGVSSPPRGVIPGDLTENGKLDIVVSIRDVSSQAVHPPGALLIYLCQEDRYSLVYHHSSPEFFSAPHLWYLEDINADQRDELIVSHQTCGAHTCFEDVQILVWNRQAFENRLEGDSLSWPYPEIAVVDLDWDGIYDLEVTGTGFGSVGAGPPRRVTAVWSWDPGRGLWSPAGELLRSSKYRIHVVHDADLAAKEGHLEDALIGYQRVLDDIKLEGWPDPGADLHKLRAYAMFKLYMIYKLQGENVLAELLFSQLESSAPEGLPWHVFAEMAQMFGNIYSEGGLPDACGAVRDYVVANENQVLPLFDYGYANPVYSAEDICPW